jgi:hypothetical protein
MADLASPEGIVGRDTLKCRVYDESCEPMSKLDLCGYRQMFGHALEERYHRKDQFKDGMTRIKSHYSQLQPGPQQRDLTVDDVLELSNDDLPYSDDWSKPDRDDLKQRMEKERVADLIRRLPRDGYDEKLIGGIRYCFRDLGLAALILHHVRPDRYAMCSHHLASLLFVSGRTVPEFYAKYCDELFQWSRQAQRGCPGLNVAETEFALWTWYWFAHQSGTSDSRRKHFRAFEKDPWVQKQRARRIAEGLGRIDKLDLARSYLRTEPTVAAIIAWREMEKEVRRVLGKDRSAKMCDLIEAVGTLKPAALPAGWTSANLGNLWKRIGPGRNVVMHPLSMEDEVTTEEAEQIVEGVREFIDHATPQ